MSSKKPSMENCRIESLRMNSNDEEETQDDQQTLSKEEWCGT